MSSRIGNSARPASGIRLGVTAYDPSYLALAQALDAPLVTRDRALAQAGAKVRVR